MPRARADRRVSKEDDVLSQSHEAARDMAAPAPAEMSGDSRLTSETLLDRILTSLDDDKAEEVAVIALKGKSEMADHMVIVSGRSSRQVVAIAENLVDRLKQEFGLVSKVEGKETGDWVLIDTGDVVVHVFRPEVRDFYQLEKMWMSPADQLRGQTRHATGDPAGDDPSESQGDQADDRAGDQASAPG